MDECYSNQLSTVPQNQIEPVPKLNASPVRVWESTVREPERQQKPFLTRPHREGTREALPASQEAYLNLKFPPLLPS